MSDADYCDLCDLPKSQCIHGNPPPPPPAAVRRTPTPRSAPVSRRTTTASTPPRVVNHRWTPPDAFKPAIVDVLEEHGGEMDQDDLFVALETALADVLKPADQETTPEGELRWRYAARRARQALIAEGRMAKGRPGVWSLS